MWLVISFQCYLRILLMVANMTGLGSNCLFYSLVLHLVLTLPPVDDSILFCHYLVVMMSCYCQHCPDQVDSDHRISSYQQHQPIKRAKKMFHQNCYRNEISFTKNSSSFLNNGDKFCGDPRQKKSRVDKKIEIFYFKQNCTTQAVLI